MSHHDHAPCAEQVGASVAVRVEEVVQSLERRTDEIQPFPMQFKASYEAGVMNLSGDDYGEMLPERSCMPAGQGSGGIGEVLPAGEIVRQVVDEARETIERMKALV